MRMILFVLTWMFIIMCGTVAYAADAHPADADAITVSTALAWAVAIIGTLFGIIMAGFGAWVSGISKRVSEAAAKEEHNKVAEQVADLRERLAVQERGCGDRHTGGDISLKALTGKIDAMNEKMDAMVLGMHQMELRFTRTLAQHGMALPDEVQPAAPFGRPPSNPGGR